MHGDCWVSGVRGAVSSIVSLSQRCPGVTFLGVPPSCWWLVKAACIQPGPCLKTAAASGKSSSRGEGDRETEGQAGKRRMLWGQGWDMETVLGHEGNVSHEDEDGVRAQNHPGWRRPPRSPCPAPDLTLPIPPLTPSTQLCTHTAFKDPRGW